MIKIDDYTFDDTSDVVFKINPSIWETPERLRDYMVSCANLYMEKSNHFSTAGFVLTSFDNFEGGRTVIASVQTYSVRKLMELYESQTKSLSERVAKIEKEI